MALMSLKFTHYYAFSAVVVLYVHFIRNCSRKSSPEANLAYYTAGKQGQEDLASCGSHSSFAQRYAMVLEELRKEADKAKSQVENPTIERPMAGSYLSSTAREISGSQRQTRQSDQAKGQHASSSTNPSHNIADVSEQGISREQFPAEIFGQQHEQQAFVAESLDDVSPPSYIADLASWGEFDSLATTGLADFGNFFPFEGLQGFGVE
jgi:galactonate dehydratase